MSIKIAPDKGSIDKKVTGIYVMPTKGGAWKEVLKGYIAPDKGPIDKLFFQKAPVWTLQSGTILSASNSGSGGYYSTVYAYATELVNSIKPTKVYMSVSYSCSSCPPETTIQIYAVAEYYNGSNWISMGGFSHSAEGTGTHSHSDTFILPGNFETKRVRYRVTNTTSGQTLSMSITGKVTEWYAQS